MYSVYEHYEYISFNYEFLFLYIYRKGVFRVLESRQPLDPEQRVLLQSAHVAACAVAGRKFPWLALCRRRLPTFRAYHSPLVCMFLSLSTL